MTVIVTETTDPVEPAAAIEGEVLAAETLAPVLEGVAEASVTVAAIEADRDVEIATIHADLERENIAAITDRRILDLERELTECRTRAETAEASNIELREELLTLRPLTVEAPPMEPNPSDEGSNEAIPANLEEHAEPPPEPVRKSPGLRWI